METFVTKIPIKPLSLIEKQMKQSKKGRMLKNGLLADYTDINLSGLKIHEPLAYTVMILSLLYE